MNYIFPKTLYRSKSSYSKGELIVMEQGIHRVLGDGHINYSLWSSDSDDEFSDRYWGQMIKGIKARKEKINHCLIMGLAGGTMAHLVNKHFKVVEIDGVEIDPVIIDIGKKYFYLSSYNNLNVIQADITKWLNQKLEKGSREKYDLIIMDLFHQEFTPPECDTPSFFAQANKLLKKDGLITLNKIFRRDDRESFIEEYIEDRMGSLYHEKSYDRYHRPLKLDNVLIYAKSRLK